MKLVPLRDRIIVEKIISAEEKTEGGIIIPDNAQPPFIKANVLAVGPETKSLQEGDIVVIARFSGTEVKHNGKLVTVLDEPNVMFKVIE